MDKIKTIIEPFKIKMVEPIKHTTEEYRRAVLKKAGYNLFNVKAEDVLIDLLTDSGTAAMSSGQWAAIMDGDESYAGARSFFQFEEAVKKITGLKNIIPTHQGRAAEKILFSIVGGKGKTIISNTHFDTTRANVEFSGARAVDLVIEEGKSPSKIHPFKGNMDLKLLEKTINEIGPTNIPLVIVTVTNNAGGGQPVSMENLRETKKICKKYGIPMYLDACRFAENAYFIKKREKGYENKSPFEISKEMFSYCDGATMSAKKDGLVNIGGFLALNDDDLTQKARTLLILTEGFSTYGGLAGRDLAAIAKGLEEVVEEDYLQYRIRSIEYVGEKLTALDIPIILPTGGHAIFVDAEAMLSHIPKNQYPAQALACELYAVGGIRGVEIGSAMMDRDPETKENRPAKMELVRLAIPRRVYTQSHMDYVVEILDIVNRQKKNICGLKMIYEAPVLRHFTARYEQV
ncbi:MAG: tryptophanase [Proteobacteria bacterium]|nr:tryptophanase [Pseudomonadota bacterium]